MKVLVIGSGIRENAICWKLAQSEKVSEIYCAPGNEGIKQYAKCIKIKSNDIVSLCDFAMEKDINLTIVGDEQPLGQGIVDLFHQNGLVILGPDKQAAEIGLSRTNAKHLMNQYRIPTAKYREFEKQVDAIQYAKGCKYPAVVKNNAFSSKNNSVICESFKDAKSAIENHFASPLNKSLVIEEFLSGKEFSLHILTDGYNVLPLPTSVIYKKVLDGNSGPNTPGMGAFAPDNFIDFETEKKIAEKIVFPLIDILNEQKRPFCGILKIEIMIQNKDKFFVVDIRPTLGDLEAQVILPLIEDDLFDLLYYTANGAIADMYEVINTNNMSSVAIMLCSGSLPGHNKNGEVIEGIENVDDDDLTLFHCSTALNKYFELTTSGHRVLSLGATATTLSRAYERTYEAIKSIDFKNKYYRKDIARAYIENEE